MWNGGYVREGKARGAFSDCTEGDGIGLHWREWDGVGIGRL